MTLDSADIRGVHLRAFSGGEAPLVAALAAALLSEKTDPETFALVAETDGTLLGHIAFSPVTVDAAIPIQGYILAPLGVRPEYQRCRLGSRLIEAGIEQLSRQGVKVLFVYGDPEYYGKFGFRAETATSFFPPYELQHPCGWLAKPLSDEGSPELPVRISCVASRQNPALW